MSKFKFPSPFHGKQVPVVYKHIPMFDWHRRLTWKERFQILIGYNVMVLVRMPTQHNPGKFIPVIALETTKHQEASGKIKEQLADFMRKKYPDGAIMVEQEEA